MEKAPAMLRPAREAATPASKSAATTPRSAMGRADLSRAASTFTDPVMRRAAFRDLVAPRHAVVQLRPKNPYNDATRDSGSNTAHHIVPDSLLADTIKRFPAGERGAVKALFLPAFGNLTLRYLSEAAIDDFTMKYGAKAVTAAVVRHPDADAVYTTKFADLSNEQKAAITINDGSFATFQGHYATMKVGQSLDADEVENAGAANENKPLTAAHKAGMLDTFYEWQAGNLFLGPSSENRLEPGDKNAFDTDAATITGDQAHVDTLKGVHDALKAKGAEHDAAPVAGQGAIRDEIRQQLVTMATTNAGKAATPAFDAAMWYDLDSAAKKAMFQKYQPGRVGAGSRVPKSLIDTIKANPQPDDDPAAVFG